jgi:Domain of unknown function (DUF4160)
MPEISRFYGIVVQIYFDDHLPPHFHVFYGENSAKIAIENLAFLEGSLPARAKGLVVEWATIHREELLEAFQKAVNLKPPGKIAPLQ